MNRREIEQTREKFSLSDIAQEWAQPFQIIEEKDAREATRFTTSALKPVDIILFFKRKVAYNGTWRQAASPRQRFAQNLNFIEWLEFLRNDAQNLYPDDIWKQAEHLHIAVQMIMDVVLYRKI